MVQPPDARQQVVHAGGPLGHHGRVRNVGKYLLGSGGGICLLTLLVFVSANASSDDFEVIDTTPYFVWGAVGGLLLVLGAIFFAAGEVIRAVSPPASSRPEAVASRSHYE